MKTCLTNALAVSLLGLSASCTSPQQIQASNYPNLDPATFALVQNADDAALEQIEFAASNTIHGFVGLAALTLAEQTALDNASHTLAAVTDRKQADAENSLYGAKFGVGPAWIFNVDRVKSATIDGSGADARVRVTDRNNDEAALLLEWHKFFSKVDLGIGPVGNFGVGPFAAVSLDSTEALIGGFGAGLMLGWMFGPEKDKASFNIGFGKMILNNVGRLAQGFEDGAPPPTGLTSVNLSEEDETVDFLMFSFRWGF